MLNGKTIAVVVPAYNEETQIGMVIETMPAFVDRIVIVNDKSIDRTVETVQSYLVKSPPAEIMIGSIFSRTFEETNYNRAEKVLLEKSKRDHKKYTLHEIWNKNPQNDRIILINHLKNKGVGAAIATGYKWCMEHEIDCTAVMAGDGQMDPSELEDICRPIVEEGLDYVKGNRLIHRSSWLVIPKIRYFGNSILSILTKLASGYWRISDTQSGYTAISLNALNAIRIYDIYKSYGMPNDMLVKLNIAYCTLREVKIKPVYNVGEQSKMKILKVIPRVSRLLMISFFKRLWIKYLFRDFHPLFLFYNLAFLLLIPSLYYGIKIGYLWITGLRTINPLTVLAFTFLAISSLQAFFFGMYMDIQDNERLYK